MLEPLLLDLIEWVARKTRSYADVMEAWRTSCPRMPVWEEAIDRGFLQRTGGGRSAPVVLTEAGRRFLRDNGRMQDPLECGSFAVARIERSKSQ